MLYCFYLHHCNVQQMYNHIFFSELSLYLIFLNKSFYTQEITQYIGRLKTNGLVDIVTGSGLDVQDSFPGSSRIFLFIASRLALGSTQPFVKWVQGRLSQG
jgi:hypothetical protein